ncbi:MAG: redoxin domain-containing protein [Bacteroidota bacterium]
MTRICIITIVSVLSFISHAKAQSYEIEIKVDGIEDSVLYLGYHFGNQKFLRDTAEIVNSTAVFKGEETLDPGVYFAYNPNTYFEFVVKEQEFSLETKAPDYLMNLKVQGSGENEVFKTFHQYMKKSQEKADGLNQKYETALNKEDSLSIGEEIQSIAKDTKQFRKELIENNEGSFVAKVLLAMEKPEIPDAAGEGLEENEKRQIQFNYYREHFFDNIDFTSDNLLRTPVIHPKIIEYMERLTPQHPDSIKYAAEFLIEKAKPNPAFFRYVLVTLTSKYEQSKQMGMDAVFVHLAEKYYLTGQADWISEDTRKKFEERVSDLKPNLIGKKAPSLNLVDTASKSVSLENIDSRYTVLYFYDPDCGHCKKKTPELRSEYSQLKELGAEVLCINIQTDVKKWKDFIKEKELSEWYNLADPNIRSNFRRDYNVKSTPTIYILDEDKKILAKKIGVEQVKEILEIEERIRTSGS